MWSTTESVASSRLTPGFRLRMSAVSATLTVWAATAVTKGSMARARPVRRQVRRQVFMGVLRGGLKRLSRPAAG
jgi:hypothetical protein